MHFTQSIMSTQSDKIEQHESKGQMLHVLSVYYNQFAICWRSNLCHPSLSLPPIPPIYTASYPASFWLLSNRQKLAFISFTLVDKCFDNCLFASQWIFFIVPLQPTNVGKYRVKWNLIPMVQESTMPSQFSSTEALMVSLLCNCEKWVGLPKSLYLYTCIATQKWTEYWFRATCLFAYFILLWTYHRLSKIRPWVMNLSGCTKRGVGGFSRTLFPENWPTPFVI